MGLLIAYGTTLKAIEQMIVPRLLVHSNTGTFATFSCYFDVFRI